MARPTTKAKPTDPLADLRPSDDAPPIIGPEPAPEQAVDPEPLKDQDWHDQRVSYMVAAWHSDPTSSGFVHHGGQCGCRYLARHALQAAVGAPVEPEPEGEPDAGRGDSANGSE